MDTVRKFVAVVLMLVAACPLATAASATAARPPLLAALDGHWTMVGDVMGKPVQYDMEAFPTLQGAFTEVHMNDVEVPSQYEARVFIGINKGNKVIVHWLDSTGAGGSVPAGTGTISGNTIVFQFPYPDGSFRDTLTYLPASSSWTLIIEAQKPDGSWQHFAKYHFERKSNKR